MTMPVIAVTATVRAGPRPAGPGSIPETVTVTVPRAHPGLIMIPMLKSRSNLKMY